MFTTVTRRAFLASSAGALVSLAVCPRGLHAATPRTPQRPVYGLAATPGIAPGTASSPSLGKVHLLDGTVLEAYHDIPYAIGAGKSVLLSPDADGAWSILYAEF